MDSPPYLFKIFSVNEFVTCNDYAGQGKYSLFLIQYLFCQVNYLLQHFLLPLGTGELSEEE